MVQPIHLPSQGLIMVSVTKGQERGVKTIITRENATPMRGFIARFDILNLVQIPEGNSLLDTL